MATAKSRFVIEKYDGFGGNFVDSQHLSHSYKTGAPEMLDNTLMRIFSAESRFFTGKVLLNILGSKSYGTKEITTEVFRWQLQGAEERSIRVTANLEPSNTALGLNNSTFAVEFDLDYCARPEVLISDPDFPCEIVDGPINSGSFYRYILRIQGDDPSVSLPSHLVQTNTEWSKAWTSTASEFNDEFGGQSYPASFTLESQVGAFAQGYTITDKAMRESGRLGIEFMYTDPKTGKVIKDRNFLSMAESKMLDELYMSMEAQYVYGKKQTRAHDRTGYWVKTGPGTREQLKDSWLEYINSPITVSRLKDFLLGIAFSRIDEGERRFTLETGTLGSLLFHDALAAEASSFLTVDSNFTERHPDRRHLSFGAQYTHYVGPEGLDITLIKNPMKDSRRYCKRMHPQYPEYPIDSARMTFYDFGSTKMDAGLPNVQILKVKDTFRHGYVPGSVGPNGPIMGQWGSAKAGCSFYTEGTGGIVIKDVSRCGEIIYDNEF